jgi:hypothetical protein
MPLRIDLTARHKRLTFAAARSALGGIVDFQKFAVTFIDANGELGWLLRPATIRGRVQALGTVPLRIVNRSDRFAVVIERLLDGRIPMRFDTRLLRNVESLRTVARHEVAEIGLILEFELKFQSMTTLLRLLQKADEVGYEAE